MGIKKIALVAALGLGMAASPVMAQSFAVDRSAAMLSQVNSQDDGDDDGVTTYVVAFFVILAIGLGIYAATDTGEDQRTSP